MMTRNLTLAMALLVCGACGSSAGGSSGPTVATVTVSPPTLPMTVGQNTQLTAAVKDANGGVLSLPVVWSSSATGVATVSNQGLVNAIAAGSATITATVDNVQGHADVTVTAATTAAECATPDAAWIWCDDFETDRLASYFEYDNPGGNFTRTANVGRNNSYGMRGHWTVGASSAGDLHLAFGKTPQTYMHPVDAGTANYREIYWRMYVRFQSGWAGGGADKLSRAHVFASNSSFAQAAVAHVWSGQNANVNYITVDPASGTDVNGNLVATTYNDPNFRWFGQVRGNTPIFSNANAGTWYCVEARAKLNDAGQSNGIFQLWVNGTLEAQETNMNWVGSYNAYGWNSVYFENYWNAGAPVAEDRYFDNLVVSTQPIGC